MKNSFVKKVIDSNLLLFFILTLLSTCEKPERIPEIESSEIVETDISFTSVLLKGIITDLGSSPIEDFGIIVSENASFLNPIPLSANQQPQKGSFQIEFTGLKINTLYYFRAYLTITGEDPIYSKTLQFKTKDYSTPTVTAGTVSLITMTSASLQGEVISDGGESNTVRGLCWGTSANPTISNCLDTTVNGSGKGIFTGTMTGLTAGNRYYARTYARNSKGTVYNSADIEFKTHDKPKVTTAAITNISANGCSTGGNVTDDGEVAVTARGVCWSTTTGPTADLTTKTTDGTGKGEYTSVISGLTPGVTYYVRAYATNQYGTSYGTELNFTTFKAANALTLDATLIGNTTATLNGSINPNGLTTTVTFEYGTTTAYGATVAAVQSPVSGSAGTNVHANITGLNPGTTYHFRVFTSNSGGDTPGNDISFTTLQPSDAITDPASGITTTTATLNGRVNANNSSSMVSFEYGTTTTYGSTVAATPGTVTGNTLTPVTGAITGLIPGTLYHCRVKSISDGGTSYGSDITFTTPALPTAVTSSATSVSSTGATLNGSVNANNFSSTVTFEYGLTTTYGASVTASQSPVTGTVSTPVSAGLTGLSASTTYHFRVKAENAAGIVYGSDLTFTTGATLVTVNDYDGNVYNVITIGSQDWMGENLKVTHFSNGDLISLVTDNATWASLLTPGMTFYNNDASTYKPTYGGIYNWYAASDVRNACPSGWHVPTDAEWTVLSTFLSGESVAGGKMKEEGTSHWASPNTGATNETGFTALPAGEREFDGNNFSALGYSLFLWSSTPWDPSYSYVRFIPHNSADLFRQYYNNRYGYSIRCIKGVLPLAETGTATGIDASSATLNGQVNPNSASTTITFEYGTSTSYGSVTTAAQSPATGSVPVNVDAGITGLTAGTTYHYRIKAVNSGGTSYGSDLTFTTPALPPAATTGTATSLTSNSATLGGTVNANNVSTTVTFEYGPTTGYGTEVTADQSPVTGSTNTAVSKAISGLTASTTYHFRVKAVSAGGTSYGSDQTFTTSAAIPTVTDYDGNIYNIITIGTQEWMGSNLKTTKYNDGLTIPLVSDQGTWGGLTTHAYCWYGNDEATNKSTYGAMYNWYAVNTGKLCPSGWHVPTDEEWTTLANYLGGASLSGGKLKETGLTHWVTPNTSATDEVGFTALPGGYRGNDFYEITITGRWWSFTESGISAWTTSLRNTLASQSRILMSKMGGMSVRCIKGTYPLVESAAATSVTSITATLNGKVNPNSASSVVTFEYGLTTAYGSEITATQSPLTGTVYQAVSANVATLASNTTYHFRVKAVNTGGTSYGADLTFTTPALPPSATTGTATSVTANSATLEGTVNANSVSTTVTFEYGLTTGYGTEVTADQSPVTGSTNTAVSKAISGLTASTTYHFRVKAVSAGGTTLGSDQTFTTSSAPLTVTDIDGNIYNTVVIGTQTWMQENLKVSTFNDGTSIPHVTDGTAWINLTTPGFCYFGNDAATYKDTYGALYNWYAVNTGKLCPTGWHAATHDEWGNLMTYLGGESIAGGKLKESGTTHWTSPNSGATNETGFTALPAGLRGDIGQFSYLSNNGFWWSDTGIDASYAWRNVMYYNYSNVLLNGNIKKHGYSVRCVKGELPYGETKAATALASTSVTLNGNVYANGTTTTVIFEYGTTIAYGSEVTASQGPVSGTVPADVSSALTELTPNTTYHYRVKAVNSGGTSYGVDMTFTTPATVADVDGNVYNTVVIGTQTWMKENLKTEHLNDNTLIPVVSNGTSWQDLTTEALCYYNNDKTTYSSVYGPLYNWYAVNSGKLCPVGWHTPSDAEWTTLSDFLGGINLAAGKLKEIGTVHWANPNTGATNETGFSSLPGGYRDKYGGPFYYILYNGLWWSNTEEPYGGAYGWRMFYDINYLERGTYNKGNGFSVRCLKD